MGAKAKIHAKDRVDVKLGITAAKAKIPAKARVDARLPKTAAKERTAALPVERSRSSVLSPLL
jgi:hypothetical protein